MKRTLGIFGVLLAVVIISYICFEFYILRIPDDPKILAKQSVLIVYAAVKSDDPKMPLFVKEVWKDERKTNSPLIGLKVAESNMSSNQVEDGEIIFFESLDNTAPRTYVVVRNGSIVTKINGKIVEMTLEQYKRSCGL
jgi:hypothetical protein